MSGTVLALRALGIGDLLTAVPALRALRRTFPWSRIVLAAPEPLRELVELVDAVDELHPTPGLGTLVWRTEPPGIAVNLHGRGPESLRDLMRTKPSALITHRHPDLPAVPGPRWRPELHEIDRWCRLLAGFGIEADPTDLRLAPPPGPPLAEGAVVIHPGAASPARRWPAERYARVANVLQHDGHEVLITGGPGETGLGRSVAEAGGIAPWRVSSGRTGLARLAATVAASRLVVCGDTGVAHLATAFGVPSVVLFGPTPPTLWGPPPWERRHLALWTGRSGDPHGQTVHEGLMQIATEEVIDCAHRLLSEASAPSHPDRSNRPRPTKRTT